MAEPWLFSGVPDAPSPATVTVIEGTTFCVSESNGDLATARPGGLFVRDTRVLSDLELTVAGRRLVPLACHRETPYAAVFVCSVALGSDPARSVLVTRQRVVGNGMREQISLTSCDAHPSHTELVLRVATDLADLFEVKDGRADGGPVPAQVVGGRRLEVRSDDYGVVVAPDGAAEVSPDALRWSVDLPAHGTWSCLVEVVPRSEGRLLVPHHPRGVAVRESVPHQRRRAWWSGVPELATADHRLTEILGTSVEDLGTLRIFDPERVDWPVVAAGAPWFMALFGRDSLLSSMMVLSLDTGLAEGTLQTLAAHQGRRFDDVAEEEPGRILHELRMGPAGTLALGGGSAYYGTADATPLFVMALGELLRWEGPRAVTPVLLAAADRALRWVGEFGDKDRDGFVEYARRSARGLRNQGWKDSWDAVNSADGTLADTPIALAEVQGYVYAALRARAALADALERGRDAAALRERADALAVRFDEAFWLAEKGWYAAALDGSKRPVDALTSSLGHLLWTGIVPPHRAAAVAAQLTSPQMFTGWGIRTLGASMTRFDPMSYHNGSVWPHDTALAVAGLTRYGFRTEAARVADALLGAAHHFGHRLPELFAGFDRAVAPGPVPVPGACSPQAWASAAPVELLRAVLGLEPDGDSLRCDPAVPAHLLPLRLSGVRCRGRVYRIEVARDGGHRVERTR